VSAVAIYLRSGEVIIVPQAGGGGHFVDVEPVLVVPPEADAVQTAVLECLVVSAANADADRRPKGWKSPVLKRLGVRTYRAFNAGASLCFVFEDQGALEVEPWQPARDGRGFEQTPAGARPLSANDELGSAVLQALGVARND
jgi:hypothetical protein